MPRFEVIQHQHHVERETGKLSEREILKAFGAGTFLMVLVSNLLTRGLGLEFK